MKDKERAKLYPVILREYNPAWPEWFADEKSNLEQLIGLENIARISHHGSTSVPGLAAKPTIDGYTKSKTDFIHAVIKKAKSEPRAGQTHERQNPC